MNEDDQKRSERPTPKQTIYDQYWAHVRHVEDEMWSFTRIWAIIITGIFGILGSEFPVGAKIGTAGFGILLCVLGFFLVYALRIPFFDFFLTLELIAKHDFDAEEPYRRFSDKPTTTLNKGIDVHDVLIVVYALTAGILLGVVGIIIDRTVLGIVAGTILLSVLLLTYVFYILPKFNSSTEDLRENIWDD